MGGSSAERKMDGEVIPVPASLTPTTPSAGPKNHSSSSSSTVKRSRPADHNGDKPKRPRPSKKDKQQSMKALLDLVGPVVTDTVNDFQRDRVAAAAAAAAAAAVANGSMVVPMADHLPGIGTLTCKLYRYG